MRILQLHTRYRQRGGEDEVVDAEAKALQEAGHEVRQLIAHNPHGNLAAVGRLALAPWNPRMVRRVVTAIEEFRPDIAHVHNTWFAMSPSVVVALKRSGVPVVMTLHNYRLTCANALLLRDGQPCELCVDGSPWIAVRYGCYRGSKVESVPAAATIDLHRRRRTWDESVDRFIVLSKFQRRLMQRAGLPGERLVVVPNCVTDPGPRPAPPSASNSVLYVGRLSEEKGVDLLLEAWRTARAEDLELLIVGDGPLRSSLSQDLPPRVRMLGRQTKGQVQNLMLRARAGVLPSRCYEGLPLTFIEFLAAGVPVLVPAKGGPAEFGRELGDDWTIEPTSPQAWARALRRVRESESVGTAHPLARAIYERSFTPVQHVKDLMRVYKAAKGLGEFHEAPAH